MEWSHKNMIHLVETYKLFKHLWDPKDKDYFKKEKKNEAWNEIASIMGTSPDACKKKITSLLATYRKEKNKIKSSMGTGKGRDELYTSRWFAYEAFRFLEDRHRPRQRLKTEQIVDTEEQIEEETRDDIQNAQETNDESSESYTVQMPPKRIKKQELQQTMMPDCMSVKMTSESNLTTPFSDTPDEVKCFGNYIISKMKSYSDQTRKSVEHAIFDILIKADRGYYEITTSTVSLPHHMQVFPTQPQNF